MSSGIERPTQIAKTIIDQKGPFIEKVVVNNKLTKNAEDSGAAKINQNLLKYRSAF